MEVLEDGESPNDVEEFDDDPDIFVEEGQNPTTYENEEVLIRGNNCLSFFTSCWQYTSFCFALISFR